MGLHGASSSYVAPLCDGLSTLRVVVLLGLSLATGNGDRDVLFSGNSKPVLAKDSP
jgi:hypothetical protein